MTLVVEKWKGFERKIWGSREKFTRERERYLRHNYFSYSSIQWTDNSRSHVTSQLEGPRTNLVEKPEQDHVEPGIAKWARK